MNLIVLKPEDFIADNLAIVHDKRFRQIRTVHRATAGDTVRVGLLNGLTGTATILSIDDQTVTLATHLDTQAPAKLPLTIILALPRPKMIRRIFRSVAELGVQELIIINSAKVEKSYWQSPALRDENIQEYLLAGLQQAKDTVLPNVSLKPLFKPFVEDELPAIIRNTQALVAHPGTGQACPHPLNHPATIAIGPEAGFTQYEVNTLLQTGFKAIHLGPRILRVENALIALVSKLYC